MCLTATDGVEGGKNATCTVVGCLRGVAKPVLAPQYSKRRSLRDVAITSALMAQPLLPSYVRQNLSAVVCDSRREYLKQAPLGPTWKDIGCSMAENGSDGCGMDASQREQDELELTTRMECICRKLLVLSGKGGVGKSTVAANLAMSLARAGKRSGCWMWICTDLVSPGSWASRGMPWRGRIGRDISISGA